MTTTEDAGPNWDDAGEGALVSSRRLFLGVASAAAMGGVMASQAHAAAVQAATPPGAGVQGSTEVRRPAKLGPKGMLDNRFPETFAESVPKACQVIMGFFTALNRRDPRAMAEYLHFPFGSFEGTEPVQVNTPEELASKPPASLNVNENPERFTANDGYMKPGCYDIFRGFEVLTSDPVVVGIAMSYDRYDVNGKKLLRCDGVYSITNNDGRWGIQLMSTIFTPADMIGIEFPDAVVAANRLRINHDLAYQINDASVDPLPQAGSRAGLGGGGGAGAPFWLAPEGKAMDGFRIKGVKSRLRISAPDAPRQGQVQGGINAGGSGSVRLGNRGADSYFNQYRALFPASGVGNWGWVYGINKDTRILHQTYNKVHQLSGATRFTVAGDEASSNFDILVVTYKGGYWGNAGSLCYVTPHDRSNDVMPPR